MRGYAVTVAASFALAVIAGSALPAQGQEPATGLTAFEGARIIVGNGRGPIENATLIVDGARIAQMGRAADVAVPAGARRVSLIGKTVMPAVIDTHTHPSHTREALTLDLQHRAYYGVGAIMSLGQDTGGELLAMRGEPIPGAARYFSAGRGITSPLPGCSAAPYWITTEAEGREAVQELAAQKVDIVKIYVDDWWGRHKKLTPALYGALINEAHNRGLRVTAHIRDLEDAKGLLRAGVDAFAHGVRTIDIDDELVAMFKQHPSVVVVPTLPNRGVRTDLSWLRESVPPALMAQLEAANADRPDVQAAFGIQARNLGRVNAAGVRIAFGTDANTSWAPHNQMADMVLAGMTPMQVIVAATRSSAEFLRMPDVGTLEGGKSADFMVLDANPLDDIANTRRISAVYLRGVAVDRGPGKGGGVPGHSQLCQP
jgi:imidazolonepropionase-like amidohydrolase